MPVERSRATRVRGMLVVCRFRSQDPTRVQADLELVRGLFAQRPGYVDGDIGRSTDDPQLWTLVTRWDNVGAYRRALSSYEIKANAIPLLSAAIDEPTAYETLQDGRPLNQPGSRDTDIG